MYHRTRGRGRWRVFGVAALLAFTAAACADVRYVFDSDRNGNQELYTIDDLGGEVTQLTSDPAYHSWWARVGPNSTLDDETVVFYRTPVAYEPNDLEHTELWTMKIDGTDMTRLRAAGQDGWTHQGHVDWSPDGTQLVMAGRVNDEWKLFVTGADGQSPVEVPTDATSPIDPSWSSAGAEILFTAIPAGFVGVPDWPDFEVHAVGVDGSNERRLTFDGLRDHDPYQSPDGTKIAWLTQTAEDPDPTWAIRQSRSDGTGIRFLTDTENISSFPQWVDDNTIVFHRWEYDPGEPGAGLFSIKLISGEMTEIIPAGEPGGNENPAPYIADSPLG